MHAEDIIRQIKEKGYVANSIRTQFFPGQNEDEIRNWLVANGYDRETLIEFNFVEVAIVTPKGLLMHISNSEKNRIEFFKNINPDDKIAKKRAIAILDEKCGIKVNYEQINYVGFSRQYLMHNRKDNMILSNSYRFKVVLDYVPNVENTFILPYTLTYHSIEFAEELLNDDV